MRKDDTCRRRFAGCIVLVLMLATLPARGDGVVEFSRAVTFLKADAEVRGVMRFRGTDEIRRSQLILEMDGEHLVTVDETLWLAPASGGRSHVAVESEGWWIEERQSLPDFKAGSFAEEIATLSAGERETRWITTSTGLAASGEFLVQEDQNRGALEAIRRLVPAEKLIAAVPAAVVAPLLTLEEIVGPHEGIPAGWDYSMGWTLTGLLGPILRERFAGGRQPESWQAVSGPLLLVDKLGEEQLDLIRRALALDPGLAFEAGGSW